MLRWMTIWLGRKLLSVSCQKSHMNPACSSPMLPQPWMSLSSTTMWCVGRMGALNRASRIAFRWQFFSSSPRMMRYWTPGTMSMQPLVEVELVWSMTFCPAGAVMSTQLCAEFESGTRMVWTVPETAVVGAGMSAVKTSTSWMPGWTLTVFPGGTAGFSLQVVLAAGLSLAVDRVRTNPVPSVNLMS